jgi:hypothetical protein
MSLDVSLNRAVVLFLTPETIVTLCHGWSFLESLAAREYVSEKETAG